MPRTVAKEFSGEKYPRNAIKTWQWLNRSFRKTVFTTEWLSRAGCTQITVIFFYYTRFVWFQNWKEIGVRREIETLCDRLVFVKVFQTLQHISYTKDTVIRANWQLLQFYKLRPTLFQNHALALLRYYDTLYNYQSD